jgi:hypothetical protein
MRRWQLTGLAVGAAALLFTAGPAQAQVWIGPPVSPVPPIGVVPPVWGGPPVSPVPPIGTLPGPVVVSPGWGAQPYWGRRPGPIRRLLRRW